MRSVYVHIPFCKSICSYCDFCKMIHNDSWVSLYLQELKNEIKKHYEEDEINTLYIGGGTPSSLSLENLKVLFNIIKTLNLSKNCEFTVEVNVNDITPELCHILKINGVNRVSVGVESFDKYNLKFLNRKHSKKDIFKNIKLLKDSGFENISVDLIYAIPIESFKVLKSDINKIIRLDIKHISTYALIIEKNTVLSNNNIKPINEELDYKMYEYICKKLSRRGYIHYEVSNFGKEGYFSKHNITYWNNDEYYGFGLGSHGYINGVRYENTRSLNKYINGKYRLSEYIVSKTEDMENELMLGLRKLEGINIYDFFQKFNINIQEVFDIAPAIKNGLLIIKDKYLMIPEDKIYIMNEIIGSVIKK